ncbi:putative inorganic phosphate cotransporter isoform X1 [Ischnura elegans]|uniref:putative inorganic phosphate cotransporter isoform X1 n=1 Tax=Ischnura elegans TaxID=197161 RepID=UPI001ED89E26|nr:putative inorganic phosphate cotransporter isoform X1 [Ischnura elegans]XP_046394180.1 putative inorganic phosphate cotransporter isoform X1 [Ischnura elegans]
MAINHTLTRTLAWLPKRYILAFMGFLALSNAYAMRVCLSIAIVEMVTYKSQRNTTAGTGDSDTCPFYDELEKPFTGGTYDWSEEIQGIVLGAFFWGYAITHLPGGRIADIYGGKYVLAIGLLITAFFTLLTPVVAEKGGVTWMIVIRLVEGLGEGITYPALNTVLAKWIPVCEKGRLGTLVFSGAQMGTIIGTALGGPLITKWGWESVFYFFGVVGILWFIAWCTLCYSTPQSHPWISTEELAYLEKEIPAQTKKQRKQTPWKEIAKSIPLWGLVCGQVGHDWGFYTLVTDLPKYMKDILHFNIKQNAALSSVPHIVMWFVAIFSGWIADWILIKRYLSVTTVRKLFTTIGSIGPAIFLVAASYAGCNRKTVVVLFTLAMGLMGAYYPGVKINALDLSSNYAGLLMAISNGIGAITGIITPFLIGEIAANHSITEWRTIFFISTAVFLVTNVIYLYMASGEEQPWNRLQNDLSPENGEKSDTTLDGSQPEISITTSNEKSENLPPSNNDQPKG